MQELLGRDWRPDEGFAAGAIAAGNAGGIPPIPLENAEWMGHSGLRDGISLRRQINQTLTISAAVDG
jgi:hypothetical protein